MKLKLRDLNKITIGNWIDLDYYYRQNEITKIASIVYNSSKDFDYQPFRFVNDAYNHYIIWRKEIMNKYPNIFIQQESNEEIKRRYEKLGLKFEEERQERVDEYSKVFSWFDIVYIELCNEDFLKMNEAYQKNVIEVFNFLTRNRLKKH